MSALEVVFAQIEQERMHQDLKWGGASSDDLVDRPKWISLIKEHLDRAKRAAVLRGPPDLDLDEYRYQLVTIAASATAAIQAHDRATIHTRKP